MTNYERLIQRLSSLNFDLNNEANAAEYHEYEKKMELTEQLTNHIDLSPQQCVALLASIVFQEKDDETVKVRAEMQPPYNKLKETARRVATVFNECKLPVDVDEYVNALKPTMLEIVYEWASGSKFSDICKLTTIFEGTIIRCIRRLGRNEDGM